MQQEMRGYFFGAPCMLRSWSFPEVNGVSFVSRLRLVNPALTIVIDSIRLSNEICRLSLTSPVLSCYGS